MLTLGIETSCDETSVAVVENGRLILSNVIFSQIELHRKTGGVVPEVAAREHVVKIVPVLKKALHDAGVTLDDIDIIAVTAGPGLLSSLLIGVNTAMTLALVHKKPLVAVNHIEGHMYANWLGTSPVKRGEVLSNQVMTEPQFPAAVLTVSGGHNELLIWRGHGKYKFLGATLDDAAGEAFDKVARLLGLPYPGGPQIQKVAANGDPKKYPLPRAWLGNTPESGLWDFSFSGLKTAVLYLLKRHPELVSGSRSRIKPGMTTDRVRNDIAASFQEAACEVLATKLVRAAEEFHVKEIHLAGGVSANQRLREWVKKLLCLECQAELVEASAVATSPFDRLRVSLRFCRDLSLCTDNAAMIAAAGYFQFKKNPSKYKQWKPIKADPNLPIKNW